MTAIAPQPAPRVHQKDLEPEQRFLLHDVPWKSYLAIGEALLDRPIRLTYDRGRLELMTLSFEHERIKSIWGRLIDVLAEELNVPIAGAGSTTQQREDLGRGVEPDQCYYTRNWSRVRGKRRLDFRIDPPPDLALEADITRSSIDRMAIYAALGVPEVWRFDGQTIHALLLGADGRYMSSDHSPTFPGVPVAELVRFLRRGETEDDVTVIREFRAWLRDRLAQPRPKRGGGRPRRRRL